MFQRASFSERAVLPDGWRDTDLTVPLVDLKAPHLMLSSDMQKEADEVAGCSDFVLGEKLRAFEKQFAEFVGVAHAIEVPSGIDTLEISLRAFGVGPGDEVITQANAFDATILSISKTGAKPVLVDVERAGPNAFGMDPERFEAAITERTKVAVLVHLYGAPARRMDEIMGIARTRGLHVVEDAGQSHGAFHYGRKGKRRAGAMGDAGCFSFYSGKNLGGWGDGGMVTVSSGALAERVRILRNYGQNAQRFQGFDTRLDSIRTAVLGIKLRHLERWNSLRIKHAKKYCELLNGMPELTLPACDDTRESSHVFQRYVVRVERRDALKEFLAERSIATAIDYPLPNCLQKPTNTGGNGCANFPAAEELARTVLSIPMYSGLTDEQIKYVASTIREFYGYKTRPCWAE